MSSTARWFRNAPACPSTRGWRTKLPCRLRGPCAFPRQPKHSDQRVPDISLDKVLFSYPGGVDVYPEPGLTLALESGVTALVGENGAGKTTLTKLLMGLLRPKSGHINVAGLDVSKSTVATMARTVGYTFQNPDDQLFERTV